MNETLFNGSGGRDRTYDQLINSHNSTNIMVYQRVTKYMNKIQLKQYYNGIFYNFLYHSITLLILGVWTPVDPQMRL